MISLFPKCRIIAVTGCAVGFMTFAVLLYNGRSFLACCAFLVCILLSFLLANFQAVRLHQYILSWLYVQCQPEEFIEGYQMLLDKSKIKDNILITMKAHLSNAYAAKGEWDKALEILSDISPSEENRKTKILLAGNRCDIFWLQENKAGMAEQLEILDSLRSYESKEDLRIHELLSVKYSQLSGSLSSDQIEYAKDCLRDAKTPYLQLNIKYLLGLLYNEYEPEFSHAYLKEVAESGKPMYIVRKALSLSNLHPVG